MNAKTYTAGPWSIVGGMVGTSAHCVATIGYADGAQRRNAQLIAAAPDMLQALEDAELEMMLHTQTNPSPALDAIRAAIAKATIVKEHNQ